MVIFKEEGVEIFKEKIYARDYDCAIKLVKMAHFYNSKFLGKEFEIEEISNGKTL